MRNHKRGTKSLITSQGVLSFRRTLLRPATAESEAALLALEGAKSVIPLDQALGIQGLPLKISPRMLADLAYWTLKLGSYEKTEAFFLRKSGIWLSDDSIRSAVNFVGVCVLREDSRRARRLVRFPRPSEGMPGGTDTARGIQALRSILEQGQWESRVLSVLRHALEP